MSTKVKILIISLIFVSFLIGVISGQRNVRRALPDGSSLSLQDELKERKNSGKFTNPLLSCGDIDSLSVGKTETLKRKVERYVSEKKSNGNISHVSVYMRDLNNGPWFGLNEKEYFYPASLLKVPLLLAAYKAEEDYPGLLDRKVTFEKPFMEIVQLFEPEKRIELGKTYTLRELLKYAIVYSDNEATALVATHVGQKYALEVFEDFGIELPSDSVDYTMRVRTYASFFRVLYNASYLSKKHSEEALELLSQVTFKDGIVAPLPRDVVVAHKFGERESPVLGGHVQLHDCGIVYAQSPYLLCVMVQGSNVNAMLTLISGVSKIVYDDIVSGK